MAKTPVTAAALESYLAWLIEASDSYGLSHVRIRVDTDPRTNAPVASFELARAGRNVRFSAETPGTLRYATWEDGAPAGPDGERATRGGFVRGTSKARLGADIQGMRGLLGWLSGEPGP